MTPRQPARRKDRVNVAKSVRDAERALINAAITRYGEWLTENPEGLLPMSHPRHVKTVAQWRLINACKRLLAARKGGKK